MEKEILSEVPIVFHFMKDLHEIDFIFFTLLSLLVIFHPVHFLHYTLLKVVFALDDTVFVEKSI